MKRFFVAVVAAVAALALAAPASATTVDITIDCDQVTFSYSNFPPTIESTSAETVTVDGQTVHTDTVEFTESHVTEVPLSITGNAFVEASAAWVAHQSDTEHAEKNVSCGGTTTGGETTGGDTTGGDTTGGDTTGGETTGGETTGGETTGGETTGGDTTGTGGAEGSTTGGSGEASGELPFTGLPIWVPILLAGALLASGAFLLRRKRDDVS